METQFQKKFKSQNDSIRGWMKSANVPLHLSTTSLVVGDAGEIPSVENHVILGYCLGFTPEELKAQLDDRVKTETNDREKRIAFIFSRLIGKSEYKPEEIELVDQYRRLNDVSKTTVRNLVAQLAG